MKKFLLPALLCSIVINSFSQPVVPKKDSLKSKIDAGSIPTITESEKWIITPLAAMTDGIGKLSMIIPKDTTAYFPILDKKITIHFFIQDTIKIVESNSSYTTIRLPKYLMTKTYNISLNGVRFTVPVKSGKETRIKAGFLLITKKESSEGSGLLDDVFDTVFGETDATNWQWKLTGEGTTRTGRKGAIYALPPGEYELTKFNPASGYDLHYKVIIKDGEWVKNGDKQ